MATFQHSRQVPTPEAFIDAAAVPASRTPQAPQFPWDTKDPQKPKAFNLRLDEQTLAKLHWLADYTPGCRSVQSWVRQALEAAMAQGIRDIVARGWGPGSPLG